MKLFNIIKRIIKRIIFSIKNSLIINISKIFLLFRDLSIPLNQHMICLSLFYVLFPSYFLRCFFFTFIGNDPWKRWYDHKWGFLTFMDKVEFMFDDEGSRYCVRESKGKACIMQEHDRGFWGTELAMLIFTCVPLCKKEVVTRAFKNVIDHGNTFLKFR